MTWIGRGEYEDELRRFELVRTEDSTGVSGTGVVACGVEFPSGSVVFEWRNGDLGTTKDGLSIKPGPDGIEDTLEVHGHGGKTKIRYMDE